MKKFIVLVLLVGGLYESVNAQMIPPVDPYSFSNFEVQDLAMKVQQQGQVINDLLKQKWELGKQISDLQKQISSQPGLVAQTTAALGVAYTVADSAVISATGTAAGAAAAGAAAVAVGSAVGYYGTGPVIGMFFSEDGSYASGKFYTEEGVEVLKDAAKFVWNGLKGLFGGGSAEN